MTEMNFAEALQAGLREELQRDESVFIMGQDVRNTSNASVVMGTLWKEFGDDRVLDTPLSETVMAGSCVGLALGGQRPVLEIMFSDFCFVCMDEIVQKMGKWRYEHGGQGDMSLPIVVMTPIGGGIGAGAGVASVGPFFLLQDELVCIFELFFFLGRQFGQTMPGKDKDGGQCCCE